MEFEEFRDSWQKQRREDYIRRPLTAAIVGDIAAEAKSLERNQLLRDSMGAGGFLVLVLAFVGILAVETSTIARAGTALVLAGLVGEFLCMARTTWLERNKRLDLPLKLALIKDRKRILAEIRRLKLRLALYAVPVAGGILLLQGAHKKIEDFFLGFIIAGCGFVVAGLVKRLLRAGTEFGTILKRIERDLADIAEIESET